MKEFPSISSDIRRGVPIFAFDKLDGSCLRAEWVRKKAGLMNEPHLPFIVSLQEDEGDDWGDELL